MTDQPRVYLGGHGKYVEHAIHIKDDWYLRIFTMKRSSGAISTTATMVLRVEAGVLQDWDTFHKTLGSVRGRATEKLLMEHHTLYAYPVAEARAWLERKHV